jgi:hypothetical protein
VRVLAEIDEPTFNVIRRVLFEGEAARGVPHPLTRAQAAVLLETMKDLLYQTYVRRAKLQVALRVRQFPPEPQAAVPFDKSASRSAGG